MPATEHWKAGRGEPRANAPAKLIEALPHLLQTLKLCWGCPKDEAIKRSSLHVGPNEFRTLRLDERFQFRQHAIDLFRLVISENHGS